MAPPLLMLVGEVPLTAPGTSKVLNVPTAVGGGVRIWAMVASLWAAAFAATALAATPMGIRRSIRGSILGSIRGSGRCPYTRKLHTMSAAAKTGTVLTNLTGFFCNILRSFCLVRAHLRKGARTWRVLASVWSHWSSGCVQVPLRNRQNGNSHPINDLQARCPLERLLSWRPTRWSSEAIKDIKDHLSLGGWPASLFFQFSVMQLAREFPFNIAHNENKVAERSVGINLKRVSSNRVVHRDESTAAETTHYMLEID